MSYTRDIAQGLKHAASSSTQWASKSINTALEALSTRFKQHGVMTAEEAYAAVQLMPIYFYTSLPPLQTPKLPQTPTTKAGFQLSYAVRASYFNGPSSPIWVAVHIQALTIKQGEHIWTVDVSYLHPTTRVLTVLDTEYLTSKAVTANSTGIVINGTVIKGSVSATEKAYTLVLENVKLGLKIGIQANSALGIQYPQKGSLIATNSLLQNMAWTFPDGVLNTTDNNYLQLDSSSSMVHYKHGGVSQMSYSALGCKSISSVTEFFTTMARVVPRPAVHYMYITIQTSRVQVSVYLAGQAFNVIKHGTSGVTSDCATVYQDGKVLYKQKCTVQTVRLYKDSHTPSSVRVYIPDVGAFFLTALPSVHPLLSDIRNSAYVLPTTVSAMFPPLHNLTLLPDAAGMVQFTPVTAPSSQQRNLFLSKLPPSILESYNANPNSMIVFLFIILLVLFGVACICLVIASTPCYKKKQ